MIYHSAHPFNDLSMTIEVERKRYYICNRKRCANCVKDCRYTTDINFAKYKEHTHFEPYSGGWYEVIRH